MLDTKARDKVQPFIGKMADFFIRQGRTANQMTVVALVLGLLPALVILLRGPALLAVSILWLSGLLDAVDGTIARKTHSMSPFGTIMDVTFDRVVELSLLLSIAAIHGTRPMIYLLLASSIVLSMTIFLTVGAASEKASVKSFYYQAGLAERTEGFILFSLMILFPAQADWIALVFAGMILFTVGQRFKDAYRQFHGEL